MEFDLNKRQCFFFNAISQIPRGSRNEKAISDYHIKDQIDTPIDNPYDRDSLENSWKMEQY